MKFIRYLKGKTEYRGILDNNEIKRINGSIFHGFSLTDDVLDITQVKLLPPVLPTKIIGLRLSGLGDERPSDLKIFLKPSSGIITSGDDIVFPPEADALHIENELGIVIGKKCHIADIGEARSAIFAITIANDVTALSSKFSEAFTMGKCFDTFSPIGPSIVTSCIFDELKTQTFVNDKLMCENNTKSLGYKLEYIISYLSKIMTLNAGDVIMTGALNPSIEVKRGDRVKLVIENLGCLENNII